MALRFCVYMHRFFRRECHDNSDESFRSFVDKKCVPDTVNVSRTIFLKADQRKLLPRAEKQQLLNILAPHFINSRTVVIREGANISNSSSNDVFKEGSNILAHICVRCKHHYCKQIFSYTYALYNYADYLLY